MPFELTKNELVSGRLLKKIVFSNLDFNPVFKIF